MHALLFLFLLFPALSSGQQETEKGFYVDNWKYKTPKTDTASFEYYKNGLSRLEENDDYIFINDYKDPEQKTVNYTLQISKYSQGQEKDSFKSVYLYKNGVNFKTIHLERKAFRQSGGCFLYDNKRSSFWYQTGYSIYGQDSLKTLVKQTDTWETDQYKVTNIYNSSYRYDTTGRALKAETFKRDALVFLVTYSYQDQYKKTETYNPDRSLKERKEESFKDNILSREVIFYTFLNYTHENLYTYDVRNRKQVMETYLIKDTGKELIRTRSYFYQ
jgi:hypothetical protein